MQDELDKTIHDYRSVPHEEWYDLLQTMEAKDNRKTDAAKIKILAASKAVPANSDRYMSARVPHKKKASNGVLPYHKKQVNETAKNSGAQHYCVTQEGWNS